MSKHASHTIAEIDAEATAEDRAAAEPDGEFADEFPALRPGGWRRVVKRILIGLLATVGVLIVLAVVLYEFGGMWGSADPTIQSEYDAMVVRGQAKPIQARFVIPIPGCICHSTDPVQTAKHRVYRMSECGRCHNGGQTAQDVPLQ
jgi:hypothetical protein